MAQRMFDKLTDDELFADWLAIAERAYDEAVHLHWNRRMYRLFGSLFQKNARLRETGGHVWNWMRQNYIAGAAMAIRRELDKDGSVANLRNMLYEMVKRPTILNRRRYLNRWNPGGEWEVEIANRAFDSFGVARESTDRNEDYVDPAGIMSDLETLDRQTETVRAYIEQSIAHRQWNAPGAVAFTEFNETVAAVEKVFKKYFALVTQSSVAQLEPVPQYNTTEVFTFAWLEPGTTLEADEGTDRENRPEREG